MTNLYDFTPPDLDSETFQSLLNHKNVTIKTIVSNTLKTAQIFEQDCDEWVVVLQGCAKIEMQGRVYKLTKGDTLFIPSQTKHTLVKTKKIVIWLAIYIK